MRHKASHLLGPDGPIAARLEGFAPRDAQRAMANAVEQAMDDAGVLICEAGTGTGKTFAYLVPALMSGGRVIVSTGTKTLQDQLFEKDLPLVRQALSAPVALAVLKGRSNYLCRYRLKDALELRGMRREQMEELKRIVDWGQVTRTGDTAELSGVSENSMVWSRVTSTPDNCLAQDCPDLDDCHVYKARQKAQAADVVVINHHLLCADLGLKDEGFGDLLPQANAYVIDEAHQLPEVAATFFGDSLSSRHLMELARDAIGEQIKDAGDMPEIRESAADLETAISELRLSFGESLRRAAWREVAEDDRLNAALDGLTDGLNRIRAQLEVASERGKGLESCHRRSVALLERLALMRKTGEEGRIHWFETFKRSFAIHQTPLDIAAEFQKRLPANPSAWIYTSATLAVDGRFDHFASALGLEEAASERWDSPFDYAANALLYLPARMPAPNSPGYGDAFMQAALPVLRASQGRAFVLFTSHRALQFAHQWLSKRLDYPLLVQGEAPKGLLLEQFRELPNAILLGTSSFWEGVDVRGEALSVVIIDKLPFASPGDPILQARIDAIRSRGEEPFTSYQLPRAVIALKQGAGRLIRDVSDRGVLMIGDPRLLGKGYGRVFLRSLPAMRNTSDIADVERFFQQ
ncbi:MAG: ATP-dependent DNA helicase [Gammaproteobacteria bacterium]